jgi:hypothetical protein
MLTKSSEEWELQNKRTAGHVVRHPHYKYSLSWVEGILLLNHIIMYLIYKHY